MDLKDSVGRLDVTIEGLSDPRRATCFLVTSGLALSVLHVFTSPHTEDVAPAYRALATFPSSEPRTAVIKDRRYSASDDWVLLELSPPLTAQPVRLSMDVEPGDLWHTFGFPDAAPRDGFAAGGTVRDSNAIHRGASALQLFCDEGAAGIAPRLRGFSGAPCVVRGSVVGIIRSAQVTTNDIAGGTLYAVPLASLGGACRDVVPNLEEVLPEPLERYLTALRTYCDSLPYLSLQTVAPHKRLDEVYVQLRARPRPSIKAGDDDTERISAQFEYPVSAEDLLGDADDRHLIVLGEAGAGKSSLLKYLARHAWSRPRHVGLTSAHLPLFIRLPDLASASGVWDARLSDATAQLLGADPRPFLNGPHPLVVLLDAFDEVPAKHRARLLEWIKVASASNPAAKVLLASRPTSELTSHGVLGREWAEYSLLPFSSEQAQAFSARWFGVEADMFLRRLELVCPVELRGTPLLLTIAAKVFARDGDLPPRRSGLYERFVAIWLEEAVLRDLEQHLPDPGLSRFAESVLQEIALTMTQLEGHATSDVLIDSTASYLVTTTACPERAARATAVRFLDALALRSGVFLKRGDHFEFAHPTLREYLAAAALVQRDALPQSVTAWVRSSGSLGTTWREVSLFGLGILSDKGVDVTDLLAPFVPLPPEDYADNEEDMSFAVAAAADGARIAIALERRIVRVLTARIEGWMYGSLDVADDPFPMLASLRRSRVALRAIGRYIRNEDVQPVFRVTALLARCRAGLLASELDLLLRWATGVMPDFGDPDSAAVLRMRIADDLSKLGCSRVAWQILLSVALAASITGLFAVTPGEVLEEAIDRLDAGAPDRGVGGLLAPGEKESRTTKRLVRRLAKFTLEDALVRLIGDAAWMASDRIQAVLRNGRIRDRRKVEAALRQVAADVGADDWHRAECALVLASWIGDRRCARQLLRSEESGGIEDSYARDHLARCIAWAY